jgi:hypothetical protein
VDEAAHDFVEVRIRLPRWSFTAALGPAGYAEHLLRVGRGRSECFPEWKLDEPGWTILLDLFVQSRRNRPVSIQSACIAAAVPATTALRHLAKLIELGAVIRAPDPSDARRVFVSLAAETEARLLEYLNAEAARVSRIDA